MLDFTLAVLHVLATVSAGSLYAVVRSIVIANNPMKKRRPSTRV